jgi:hypothetical protein
LLISALNGSVGPFVKAAQPLLNIRALPVLYCRQYGKLDILLSIP